MLRNEEEREESWKEREKSKQWQRGKESRAVKWVMCTISVQKLEREREDRRAMYSHHKKN